ncbi:MAG: hypothetical protein HGB33_04680, partial [Syntrophaceae bacterium]|nr:hypothetical protein [Syntrophaceae bacterium]
GKVPFPFSEFFAALREINAEPTITLEAHAEDNLWESLGNIKELGILEG